MAQGSKTRPIKKVTQALPTNELTQELKNLGQALAERGLQSLAGKVEGITGRLTDYAADGGGGGLISAITGSTKSNGSSKGSLLGAAGLGAVKGALGGIVGGLTKGNKKLRFVNIAETLDIGAPVRVVYNQWTQFQDFPTFMKKVEHVGNQSDETVDWKAQIFWSHRNWESQIVEQVPDELIIWRSKGAKGYVDGAVSFHALAPNLTRVLLVLEYHPKGLVEHVGNLWRAQGRRVRLEFKHFRRHVMTQTMLHPEEIADSGWRGVIHDGEVVKDHETALQEERAAEEEEPEEDEFEEEEEEEEEPEEEEEAPEEEEDELEEEEPEEEEEEEEEPEEEQRVASAQRRPRRGSQAPTRERPVRRRAGSRSA